MPIFWDTSLQILLPISARKLLEAQQVKLATDWATVSAMFSALSYEAFLHNWLIVNTRTFYFLPPSLPDKIRANIPRECRMTLNPFADYFNHSSAGCTVTFSPSGYMITTPTPIKKGEEIYITYGNHSNDFLLVEYGFVLEVNDWDEVSLDEFILPLLGVQQQDMLERAGFLGKYILDKHTVCYRTQVALRSLSLSSRKWQRFVGGLDTGEKEQKGVDKILLKVLSLYRGEVSRVLAGLSEQHSGLSEHKETLFRRFKQIDSMLTAAVDRIKAE